jgi:hypothetical protein
VNFRIKRKKKAADLLYHFLADLLDVNRIVQIIKRFRFLVTQSQTYYRRFKEVQQAQLTLLTAQFDQVEEELLRNKKSEIEDQRKKEDIMKNALNYTSVGKKKRKEIVTGRKGSLKDQTVPVRKATIIIPTVPE